MTLLMYLDKPIAKNHLKHDSVKYYCEVLF